MKRSVFTVLVLAVIITIAGCEKKHEPLEEMQQPMSPEDLSRITTENQPPAAQQKPQVAAITAMPVAVSPAGNEVKLDKLPPAGPYKPTNLGIQTALKNSGFYTAKIDGKIGPLTKKAIEEFQKQNNLDVDGKVGPKTWGILSKYLDSPSSFAPADTAEKDTGKR